MRTLVGIVILAAAVTGLYFVNQYARTADGKSVLHVAQEVEIEVEAARPEQRVIIRTVQAPGEVEAFAEVDISSEVVGKIIELPVKEGQAVKQGDLLCRLDDTDYRARLVSAAANIAKLKALITQAEADMDKAQRDYDRQKRLIESEATSMLEMANYRTALIGAQTGLEVRKQELIETQAAHQAAGDDLERTVIRSPIDGIISQLFAEQGEVVITGTMNNLGTRIMVVSDLSVMQVRCRIDETDAPLVEPGQTARIYLQSDSLRGIAGDVVRVATKGTKQLGRDVVSFETLVLVTGDDDRVRPGMSANVEIEVARREDALTVPVQAVVYRKQRDLPEELIAELETRRAPGDQRRHAEYVKLLFIVEDGKARARLIETGVNDTTSVEVTEGLELADLIVTGPFRSLDQLKAGAAVKLDEKSRTTEDALAKAAEVEKTQNEASEAAAANPQPTSSESKDDETHVATSGAPAPGAATPQEAD